jgi:hypothetical protein
VYNLRSVIVAVKILRSGPSRLKIVPLSPL